MTEQSTPATQDTPAAKAAGVTAVAGPLTIRDLAVLASVVLIFIASLIPLLDTRAGSLTLWNTTNLFYMAVGMILPLATAALFLIRRFSPGTRLRLGSLSLDQFASVVAVFTAFFYFASITTNFRVAYLVGMIGGVLFLLSTVCAPWIPVLAADFAGRPEVPAHPVARDGVAPLKRPSAPKPVAKQDAAASGSGASAGTASGAGSAGAAGAAGAAGTGPTAGSAGWSGNRPADVHTAAGQIYTPAKNTPAGAAGSAGSAGAAAASATPATPSVEAAGTPAASSDSGTSAADAAARGTAADEAAKATDAKSSSATPEVSSIDADDQPTTINPQLPTAADDKAAPSQPAKDSAKPAETEKPAPAKDAGAPAKESITATVDPKTAAPAVSAEPFWFAVDRPQNVIDEKTRQFIYKLTPGSWILALEDRGNSFLVQDSHGKTGVLLDLVGIERASDSQ